MKKLAALLAAATLLLAGGCVSVRLDYGMDGSGGISSVWKLEARRPAEGAGDLLDQGMQFAHEQVSQMASQWETRGIATEALNEEGAEGVTGRREFSGSREKAFEELVRWMKEDGGTPFTSVTANHFAKDGVEEYFIDAALDWKDLISPATLSGASAELRAGAEAVEKNCQITVSVRLPGTAVEHEGDMTEADGAAVCSVTTSPGKPARIMLHTRIVKEFTAVAAASTTDPDTMMKWGLVGICALAGLLMLIIAVRCIVKMARYRGY